MKMNINHIIAIGYSLSFQANLHMTKTTSIAKIILKGHFTKGSKQPNKILKSLKDIFKERL